MRVVIAVIAIVAAAAVAWLVLEARALRSPPPAPATTPPPIAATPPPSPPPPPPPAPTVAAPSRPATRGHALALPSAPVVAPAEPAQPPPPSGAVSPAELAAARARVEAVLAAVTRVCPLPRDADRSQHLVVRVTTSRDRVQTLEHRDGALPAAVAACIDKRLSAARWPAIPAPVTLELDVRAADLQ